MELPKHVCDFLPCMLQIGDRGSLETDPLVSASISKSLGDATVERILRQHQPKAISMLGALKIPVSMDSIGLV